jgi:transcriptional regulator GlxA family with amidase domain
VTKLSSTFDELRKFSEVAVVYEKIVDQGEIITARGVTSSIDLRLYLCEKLAGCAVKEKFANKWITLLVKLAISSHKFGF